jgi:hypothetical protein
MLIELACVIVNSQAAAAQTRRAATMVVETGLGRGETRVDG